MSYILLKNQNLTPPETQVYNKLMWELLLKFEGKPVAFDFETTGLSAISNDIVSVGLANETDSIAIWLEPEDRVPLCKWLTKQQLIAHNYIFDGAFVTKYTGQVVRPLADTLVLFKTLANEGWTGQSWSLKKAMLDVLGWPEVNNKDLQDYMDTYKVAMHRVPFDILGKYNALDAAATYQLWQYLMSFTKQFPALESFWLEEWANLEALLIEQHMNGITIDVGYYRNYMQERKAAKDILYAEFIGLVREHIQEYNRQAHAKLFPPFPEDAKTKKDLSPTKRYLEWLRKEEESRYAMHFNIDSNKDLCWLIYGQLKFEVAKVTPSGAPSIDKNVLHLFGDYGKKLKAYRKIRDEMKFIQQILDDQVKGVVYPNIKIHGTITGRCSSGMERSNGATSDAVTED
jgi:DNA polymerase I-like protein with 3'-5' exonuclease and polymerase domains